MAKKKGKGARARSPTVDKEEQEEEALDCTELGEELEEVEKEEYIPLELDAHGGIRGVLAFHIAVFHFVNETSGWRVRRLVEQQDSFQLLLWRALRVGESVVSPH